MLDICHSTAYPALRSSAKRVCGLEADSFRSTQIDLGRNPHPTAFPYGNGMVLHFCQQQESSTTKTVHKVINRGLKAYV